MVPSARTTTRNTTVAATGQRALLGGGQQLLLPRRANKAIGGSSWSDGGRAQAQLQTTAHRTSRRRWRGVSMRAAHPALAAIVAAVIAAVLLLLLLLSSRGAVFLRRTAIPLEGNSASATSAGSGSTTTTTTTMPKPPGGFGHVYPDDSPKSTTAVSPFTSHPPDPIAFDAANARHRCLRDIRSRQAASLSKYLQRADHILLVDPAYHSNVGDHMITVGEVAFLTAAGFAQNASLPSLSQCSYAQAGNYVPKCDAVLKRPIISSANYATQQQQQQSGAQHDRPQPHLVAVWHGGGNFGDLWPQAQEPRIESLAPLLKAGFAIVTMPNSWFYSDAPTEARDVARLRAAVADGLGLDRAAAATDGALARRGAPERVVFCWRERVSWERGARHLSFATHVLVPDIAFQLGPYASIPPAANTNNNNAAAAATDILWLLRDDHESVFAAQRSRHAVRSVLQSVPGAAQLTFSIVDWNDRLFRFDSTDIFFTDTAIKLLSLGRVVICDRLHAAILAYLAGIPFIYMDQLTGKITKTLTVAMESGPSCRHEAQWSRAHNMTDAVAQAVELLGRTQVKELTREQRRDQLRKSQSQSAS